MSAMFTCNTPWGKADRYENLGQGVFTCSTPSHGGIFVPDCMLHNIPERMRRWAKRWSGSENWYEEDCCWAAVADAMPNYFEPAHVEHARRLLESMCRSGSIPE